MPRPRIWKPRHLESKTNSANETVGCYILFDKADITSKYFQVRKLVNRVSTVVWATYDAKAAKEVYEKT